MAGAIKQVLINVKSNTKGVKALRTEFDKLTKDNKELGQQYKKTNAQLQKSMSKSKSDAKGMGDVFNNLGFAISGAFAVMQVINFGKQVFNVTAEFQKLEAVLTNTLGSKSEAQLALAQIQKFASETPFSVLELTDSFIKLTNQGFKPSMEEMTKLGDLASSTGKSFDMLAEAIIDGQVGEFERLKEFGIRASKQGDIVAFTFKGVTTEVARTEQAMRKYIVGLGDVEGVSGAMSAISATLSGQVSNLGDAWDSMLNSVGGQTDGVFSNAITLIADLVKEFDKLAIGIDGFREKQKLIYGDEMSKRINEVGKAMTTAGATEEEIMKRSIQNINNQITVQKNKLLLVKDWWSRYEGDILKATNAEKEETGAILGNIEALRDLIFSLRDGTFEWENRKKVLDDVKEAETDLIKIQQNLLKIAKEMDGSTENNLILRRQKIDSINEEIKRLKSLQTMQERQIALDKRIYEIELAGQHDRTLALIEAEKAQDDFIQKQREMAREVEFTSLALMDETDVVLDLTKAFNDNGMKTDEQIERQKEMGDILREGMQLTADTSIAIYQQQLDKQATAEIDYLDTKLARNQISDEIYARERKKILRKQYEDEKKLALISIAINGALAISDVWSKHAAFPPTAAALTALTVAQTAAQIALVVNQPVPTFEKGGEIGGQRHTDGGTMVNAEKGEFIINRTEYGKNKAVINAINDGKFDKYIHEQYIIPTLKISSITDRNNDDLARNIADSIMLHTQMDDQRIVGHLKMNRESAIDNARALVNALGSKRKDLRNV